MGASGDQAVTHVAEQLDVCMRSSSCTCGFLLLLAAFCWGKCPCGWLAEGCSRVRFTALQQDQDWNNVSAFVFVF
jgi:hypothetical protein